MNRNPWTGISVWQEFKWDVTHVGAFFGRIGQGLRDREPLSVAFLISGVMHAVVGAVLVLYG